MPRNLKADRPSCPEAYAYIEEAQARLDGSKPVRSFHGDGHDEGRKQVWEKLPSRIRNALIEARDRALPHERHPSRKRLAFNIAWLHERYAP